MFVSITMFKECTVAVVRQGGCCLAMKDAHRRRHHFLFQASGRSWGLKLYINKPFEQDQPGCAVTQQFKETAV
jgi:hypothetical protein